MNRISEPALTPEQALAHAFHNVYVSSPVLARCPTKFNETIARDANERRLRVMFPKRRHRR